MAHHFVASKFLYQIGWSGVDLFFVLSGFLISGLLFDEYKQLGHIHIGRFWIRRGFKIYPSFYLLTSISVLALAAIHRLTTGKLLSALFFVQSYFPHIWGHTWSLAVEEHFYFTLPLLLIVLTRVRRSNPFGPIPWVFGIVAALCLLLRLRAYEHGLPALAIHTETHLRIDGLFFGVLLSYVFRFHESQFRSAVRHPVWLLGLACLIPMCVLPMDSEFIDTGGLTLIYLGYGLILAWSVVRPEVRSPLLRVVGWIGRYSYSIYLWHIPLRACIYRGQTGWGFFMFGGALSIVFGVAMAELIEIPALKVRDRLFPGFAKPKWSRNP